MNLVVSHPSKLFYEEYRSLKYLPSILMSTESEAELRKTGISEIIGKSRLSKSSQTNDKNFELLEEAAEEQEKKKKIHERHAELGELTKKKERELESIDAPLRSWFSGVVKNWPTVTCDICKQRAISGIRFKCNACPNFDMCLACWEKDDHRNQHNMLLMIK